MLEFQTKHKNFNERNQLIADSLPHDNSWVLDVGSNTGYTSRFLSDLGHFVLGVEKMEPEYKAAQEIQGPTTAFMNINASPEFFQNGPHWSAILLLSVLHRMYALEGEEFMRGALLECAHKTDNLFIEGSTSLKRYIGSKSPKPAFSHLDVESSDAWHREMFSEVLGDAWEVQSQNVLNHTEREPHRILYHIKKNTVG
ncbi:MAG: hypothetical protein ACPGUX_00835 [Halocynthiibacter sp.]